MTTQGDAASGPQVAKGLEGIVAAATNIAEVNGELGRLTDSRTSRSAESRSGSGKGSGRRIAGCRDGAVDFAR